VVFKDLFATGLHMPSHPMLAEILSSAASIDPSAIVQIGKFVWVVSSCGGHPIADLFA
jgi:hypothetical protein